MKRRSVMLCILGAAICQCGVACVGTNTFVVSSVSPETGQEEISKIGKFMVSDASVAVKPANAIRTAQSQGIVLPISTNTSEPKNYFFSPIYYKNPRLDTSDPFVVEILIATGNHRVVFGAMALTIKSEKGNEGHPIETYRLAPMYATTRFLDPVTPFCRHPDKLPGSVDYPLLSQFEQTSHDPVHLLENTTYCFAVKFDIPPIDPRTTFSITLKDLSVDGRKVSVPTFHFVTDVFTQKVH